MPTVRTRLMSEVALSGAADLLAGESMAPGVVDEVVAVAIGDGHEILVGHIERQVNRVGSIIVSHGLGGPLRAYAVR